MSHPPILTWIDIDQVHQHVRAVEAKYDAEAAAYLLEAAFAVESLAYLLDVDKRAFHEDAARPFGYHEQPVNVAHARWAVTTAVTALDLLAACLGRVEGLKKPAGHELDIRQLSQRSSQLRPASKAWLDRVEQDPRYPAVQEIRNALVHRRMGGSIYLSNTPKRVAGHLDPRQSFRLISGPELGTRRILEDSFSLCRDLVGSFYQQVVPAL